MRTRAAAIGILVAVVGCGEHADAGADDGGGTLASSGETTSGAVAPGEGSSEEAGETLGTSSEASSADVADTSGPSAPMCGDGILDADESCDDGNQDAFDGCRPDCTAVALLDPPALEWTYFEIEGTRCLGGDPAGFGISHAPDSTNVMIYLEGGGACFNDACDFTAFESGFSPPTGGIFARDDAANPMTEWTMIYVPYCSGDIHAGSAEKMLGGKMRYFNGYDNITQYLQRWVPSFPETETVLLTGSSAGGFGAALNAHQVADAWGDDVQLVVVDDSGPPLSSDVMPPCLQEIFRQTWGLDGTVLAECPGCDPHDFASDLYDEILVRHPSLRLGLFSNTADLVIRTYMGFGWGNGGYDNCGGIPTPVPFLTYNNDLIATRAAYEDVTSTFYVNAAGHTALRGEFTSTSVDGTTLAAWVAEVIAGAHVHVGP